MNSMTSGRMHGIMILSNKRVFYEIAHDIEREGVAIEWDIMLIHQQKVLRRLQGARHM